MSEAEPSVRRVITGHDAQNQAKTLIDGPVANIKEGQSGSRVYHIWNTDRTPAPIATGEGIEDLGLRPHVTSPPHNGTRFAVIDYAPGNRGSMHRTETIDYVIVLAGAIDMEYGDGSSVHLEAGDVMVQRGTVHKWCNRGTEVARIAFVLVDAEPLGIGSPRTLENVEGGPH